MGTTGAQLGNKNAVKGKLVRESILRALARACGSVSAGLDKTADVLVQAALNGDQWAWEQVANRIDGKPPQAVELSGSLVTEQTREQLLARLTELHAAAIAAPVDGAASGIIGSDAGAQGE